MNFPFSSQLTSLARNQCVGYDVGQSGITGAISGLHVPQKTTAAHTAKTAVNAANHPHLGLRRIYLMNMIAMIAKTIVKMATVSTMPSAPK